MRNFLPGKGRRLGLLICGLGLLSPPLHAALEITQVEADGYILTLPNPSLREGKPPRISSQTRALSIAFTAGKRGEADSPRLRYKLEGYDTVWRDLPTAPDMRLTVEFLDADKRMVGNVSLPMRGETPGWTGQVETAPFVARQLQARAPDHSCFARIIVLSQGAALGLVALDSILMRIEHAAAGTTEEFDLSVREGVDLDKPLGRPALWNRDGPKSGMAQLRTRNGPPPKPVLAFYDDDASQYAAWSVTRVGQYAIHPGDHLTLSWETAHSIGSGGSGKAMYPALALGHYRFRVAAARPEGTLTGEEVSLPIVIVAPFYRRTDFWLAVVLAGGLLTMGMIRWAVQHKMRRELAHLARQQELARERARIARDLHDDIGAGLTEIAMQSDWILRAMAQGAAEDSRRRVERVGLAATELARNVDEIVWAVTPANDTLQRFVNYLTQSTEQFLDAAGLRVRFDIPRDLPDIALDGTVRHTLFLATREALNNAVKHARADIVRLEIRLAADVLHIAIEDKGVGFLADHSGAAGTHEGLNSMRKRMEHIGGTFRLISRPAGGTRVELSVSVARKSGGS